MSNSQNSKNEQQNNLCTTSLTEQWKKGELKERQYFVKMTMTDAVYTADYFNGCFYDLDGDAYYDEQIKEVLAPVPSYMEWKNVTTCFDYEHKAYLSMVEENQQLKELLYSLKCCLTSQNIEPQIRVEKSLAKINEVLK